MMRSLKLDFMLEKSYDNNTMEKYCDSFVVQKNRKGQYEIYNK